MLSTAAVVGVLAALGAAVSAHAGPAPPMGQSHLHGLDNVGGQLGTAASHGCVRLADSTVAWLAARIGPGVPVTIL